MSSTTYTLKVSCACDSDRSSPGFSLFLCLAARKINSHGGHCHCGQAVVFHPHSCILVLSPKISTAGTVTRRVAAVPVVTVLSAAKKTILVSIAAAAAVILQSRVPCASSGCLVSSHCIVMIFPCHSHHFLFFTPPTPTGGHRSGQMQAMQGKHCQGRAPNLGRDRVGSPTLPNLVFGPSILLQASSQAHHGGQQSHH